MVLKQKLKKVVLVQLLVLKQTKKVELYSNQLKMIVSHRSQMERKKKKKLLLIALLKFSLYLEW